MEIKQLEYFVTAVDYGSLNKAAEQLYTTQPNVSRVLSSLEQELKTVLFTRNNKGIKMTEQGELLYGHAVSILKHSHVIQTMTGKETLRRFGVSGYRSSMLTKLMVDIYQERGSVDLQYEYREGSVEEITDDVANHSSEIGIVYLAKAQLSCFKHIIEHKKLEYVPLGDRGIRVYMGKNHPYYQRESLEFADLENLKFMEENEDFFAMEHHIERVSVGAIVSESLDNVFKTNSDYMMNNLLLHSDVCCTGIDFVSQEYGRYDIRALKVNHCERFLTIGYVKLQHAPLSKEAARYVELLEEALLVAE